MEANQSIKSSLIHNGLSAEKEEAVRKFYQNLLRIMGSASEYGLDFQFELQMKVSASPEEMPSAILDASASAAEERAEDMEERHKREMAEAVEKAWDEGAMDGVYEAEEKHAMALAEAEARHKREMAERDKRYADALAPLIDVRDKMRAECEKKCHDAERRSYAAGYAFADQKWNPVYKAVCEELELVRKEGANHEAGYIRLIGERDELILAQADLRQELDENAEANEKLEAQAEELREELAAAEGYSGWYERCVAAQNAAEKLEEMRTENKALKEKHDALLELVEPTVTLMKSNPELFGGEAKGTSSSRPTQWRAVSEEETERAEKFLKGLEAKGTSSPRPPAILRLRGNVRRILAAAHGAELDVVEVHAAVVESVSSPLPGLVDAEGLCRAWPIEEDQPTVCGATGCIDCPAAEAAKLKLNYNHPNWPSPITKRFAKHLAKYSGLRSPWHSHDPKAIKTHEDALEYIAKRVNISVENLLGWTRKQYQTTYDPWTLVKGPDYFHTGTAPATWWC